MGALWIRPGSRLRPLMVGGAQEFGKRPGAENVPAIIAMGVAAGTDPEARATHRRRMAARLWNGLRDVPGAALTGQHMDDRIPDRASPWTESRGNGTTVAIAGMGVLASPGSTCAEDAGRRHPRSDDRPQGTAHPLGRPVHLRLVHHRRRHRCSRFRHPTCR
ncbi:MAG: hypothetical protein R2878_12285 [Thermoleophilia bacterium]